MMDVDVSDLRCRDDETPLSRVTSGDYKCFKCGREYEVADEERKTGGCPDEVGNNAVFVPKREPEWP